MSAVKNLSNNGLENIFTNALNETLNDAFDDAVNAAQKTFRSVLEALSRPGSIVPLQYLPTVPSRMSAQSEHASQRLSALLALARTLCDADTPVWFDASLQSPALDQYMRFHCGSPILDQDDTQRAAFAFIGEGQHMPRLHTFNQGSLAYPDRSTTLFIACALNQNGVDKNLKATGPGIAPWQSPLALPFTAEDKHNASLPAWFWEDFAMNSASYPTGVDCIFVDTQHIMALPRSVRVQQS